MREQFVKEFGELLNKYNLSEVESLETKFIDHEEYVIIHYTTGKKSMVITTAEPYISLVEKVCRNINLKLR